MTAAPRTICASLVDDLPRSRSTRAVIPTLVADRLAPRNMWTGQGLREGADRTAPSPDHRRNHPHDGHHEGRRPDPAEVGQVSLEPDLEEQHDDPDTSHVLDRDPRLADLVVEKERTDCAWSILRNSSPW